MNRNEFYDGRNPTHTMCAEKILSKIIREGSIPQDDWEKFRYAILRQINKCIYQELDK